MTNTPHPLKMWLHDGTDLTALMREERQPSPEPAQKYTPKKHDETVERAVKAGLAFYIAAGAVLLLIFGAILWAAVFSLPPYEASDAPTVNEVAARYVEQGTEETGAVNTVAGMILDYRAFDTLGESFVLFTALGSVALLLKIGGRGRKKPIVELDVVDYSQDVIVRTVSRLVIPVILVFGVYILCNGHLSPGGGFSGGAILASAFVIYAMVWGDDTARHTLRPALLRWITFSALAFYGLSKTYSFFTGANHLPSFIHPGTPGRILSGGLILPLNVAVGAVVCCTMYSFYLYFRRGEL